MENFRLKVFRAVARHRNFRVAAEELLLTQPAVTQQIKSLESELDTPLFDRAGGRITLTRAGAVLVPFAEQLAALANEARQAVSGTTGIMAGTLNLAASQTISQYLLPRLIAGFMAEHPSNTQQPAQQKPQSHRRRDAERGVQEARPTGVQQLRNIHPKTKRHHGGLQQ